VALYTFIEAGGGTFPNSNTLAAAGSYDAETWPPSGPHDAGEWTLEIVDDFPGNSLSIGSVIITYCQLGAVCKELPDTTKTCDTNPFFCEEGWNAIADPSPDRIICAGDNCTNEECCIPTCVGTEGTRYKCGDGWLEAPDFASIECGNPGGCSNEQCCTPTCATFGVCRNGLALDLNTPCDSTQCTEVECCASCGNGMFEGGLLEECDLTAGVGCPVAGSGCDMHDCTCKPQACCELTLDNVGKCKDVGVVTDVSFSLLQVSLIDFITLDMSQTWAADLEIALTPPDGHQYMYVPLSDDGGADDLGDGSGNVAPYSFAELGAPFQSPPNSNLIPAGTTYAANTWPIRSHAAGDWRFEIVDDAQFDETCVGSVIINYCEFRDDGLCDDVEVIDNLD